MEARGHMRKRKGAEEERAAVVAPEHLQCKRHDGKGWRCVATAMSGRAMCEKHYLQQRRNSRGNKPSRKRATINRSTNVTAGKEALNKKRSKESPDHQLLQQKSNEEERSKANKEREKIIESRKLALREPQNEKLGVKQGQGSDSNPSNKKKKNEELSQQGSNSGRPVRVLRKYLPNGIMEIPLEYDPELDFPESCYHDTDRSCATRLEQHSKTSG
uniref:TSA: Wollemia nobilis Ref_Wollemi_Transcript_2200_937 transcribed RNA sequence n=1 Tax=Wollemia nobilis TaxID=56998 RepID=A0A0C9S931_9CONI